MLVSNKIGFKRFMFAVVLLLNITLVNAQNNTVSTHAGPKGIWVLCGKQLPKDFTYRVLRQKNKEAWVKQVDLRFPESKEELRGELLKIQGLSGLTASPMADAGLELVWDRLTDVLTVNLPNEMLENYPLRQANGTAWYDSTADSAIGYAYKVQVIGSKEEVISESSSKETYFPGKSPETNLSPLSIRSVNGTITGEYSVVNRGLMNSCRIFRSYYLRKGFEEVQGEPIFLTRDSALILQFTDKTTVEKVPYTYAIRSVDAAGNTGGFSAELSAFNVADKSIIPSVMNFKTSSVEKEKAIQLSWNLKDSKDVISIDIFKGADYDGNYVKIASVSPKDTTYLDHYANPVETYYYTIRLNGTYEKSPASPRVSGILKASSGNYFPPKNLRLMQRKNVVNLVWERTEEDTRAYYVYRSVGKTQRMERISPVIITDSAIVSYTDTLAKNMGPGMYAYAVSDQNTSYELSDLSKPVFAHIQGPDPLPVPHDLTVMNEGRGVLRVSWPDMRNESPFVQGYMLYRRAKAINDTVTEPLKPLGLGLLDPVTNTYRDSAVKTDMVYYYSLRTVGNDEETMSSPSLEAGITIQPHVINGAANVRVFRSGAAVAVKWNNPVGDELKSVKIIRSTEGREETEEIASLNATTENFADTKVTVGNTYYYQVQIENKLGKKSRMTDAVGIKVYE
ncbi:fibronectin type 3 domain-containing protein [Pedobacter africanus]|uniref:Fibronectin type 3 domain-containing protein n=1 Tax=Pedobacter africanus TaxID=151894 RepID=A0ACC6L1U6_9SPHI|nr:hypothetical protein [Pedobacter africanus]MDR6785324.1 fibronectin type 3 domain-containing protein [Pedobacter africanus]